MKLKEKLFMKTSRIRGFKAVKKAASEENLRRRRLKNKKEKPFMRRIRGREGVELQIKLPLMRI